MLAFPNMQFAQGGEAVTNVIPFPAPREKAATCGCGGQMFLLVCTQDEKPDIVVCAACDHECTRMKWEWTDAESATIS